MNKKGIEILENIKNNLSEIHKTIDEADLDRYDKYALLSLTGAMKNNFKDELNKRGLESCECCNKIVKLGGLSCHGFCITCERELNAKMDEDFKTKRGLI